MALSKAKPRNTLGDIRSLHNTPGLWAGRKSVKAMGGLHAVNEMNSEGCRTAMCGLIGRFITEPAVHNKDEQFINLSVKERCSECHQVWISLAAEGAPLKK